MQVAQNDDMKAFSFFVNFFTNIDIDYHWEFAEPLAQVTGNENAFKCKQLHERHTHVSGFRNWLVKEITKIVKLFTKIVKLFTKIVKLFTWFLSISKLFRNVNVYSLVFVDLWSFHKVPRKMIWPYNYGLAPPCKRFQVSRG